MTRTIVAVLLFILATAACGGLTTRPTRYARPADPAQEFRPPHHPGRAGPSGHSGAAGPSRQPDQPADPGRDPPVQGLTCHTTAPSCGAATVVRIVDGDTVILRTSGGWERVRLIGVDAPETWLRHDCFGTEATQALQHLIPPGSVVHTVPDTERRDRFGRLLLYLWTPKGDFVNEALVRAGFARTMTVPPDTSHASTFHDAERTAQRTHRGLWHSCE